MLVRLIFPWDWSNTLRLIPNCDKKIGDVEFTTNDAADADLAVIVNYASKDVRMRAKEAWIFHHEPSNNRYFSHWKKAYPFADKVFGVWDDIESKNFIKSIPYLFWHGKGSYDYYKNLDSPDKTVDISCITSSKTAFRGHKERLKFLFNLQKKIPFEIKGRGISAIDTKDEVLNLSKYSVVIENTKAPMYFTEKIIDAYLCYNVPVYFGAPDIFDYFPENSAIILDSLDVDIAYETICRAIKDNFYEKNLDKIIQARNLVLDKYNFYTNLVSMIDYYGIKDKKKKDIYIPKSRAKKHPLISDIKSFFSMTKR